MTLEWLLDTPVTRTFGKVTKIISQREVPGVDENGEPTIIVIDEEIEHLIEVEEEANRVRLLSAGNNTEALQFHIRLIYGRLSADGEFLPSIRDNGIVIGGPEYAALDADQDGHISEDELLNMSAKILRWDGELKDIATPTEEGVLRLRRQKRGHDSVDEVL